jgi:hypothetical protein
VQARNIISLLIFLLSPHPARLRYNQRHARPDLSGAHPMRDPDEEIDTDTWENEGGK